MRPQGREIPTAVNVGTENTLPGTEIHNAWIVLLERLETLLRPPLATLVPRERILLAAD